MHPALPADKSDLDSIGRLARLSDAELMEVLPELLTWTQDMNWPVAWPIGQFLSTKGSLIVPDLRKVLQGRDDVWKYWVLVRIVPLMDDACFAMLLPDIQLLAETPSDEEVDNAARELLSLRLGI